MRPEWDGRESVMVGRGCGGGGGRLAPPSTPRPGCRPAPPRRAPPPAARPASAMVQANEEVMCDSRPSTSGSGPYVHSKASALNTRWPGGARPKIFNHRSFSSGSRPSVLSRASGSLRSVSRPGSRAGSGLGSRGSLLSGSVGTAEEVGSGVSRLRRELPSISDICGYDEVQELLRDIEQLECRRWTSDWDSFTIQSSHADLDFPHDRDFFPPDLDTLSRCDSRLSWDSHAGRHPDDEDDDPHPSPDYSPEPQRRRPTPTVTLAWDDSHLKTSVGIFRLLLVVVSVITMTCACTVGTARLSIFVLPGAWRLRVVVFTAVFTILTTTILLLLHLSSLVHSLTLRWDKLVTVIYVAVCVCYLVSASLLLHLLHLYHTTYPWIPAWTKQQLLTTSMCPLRPHRVSGTHPHTHARFLPSLPPITLFWTRATRVFWVGWWCVLSLVRECVCWVSVRVRVFLLPLFGSFLCRCSNVCARVLQLCGCACGVVSLVLAVISGCGWPRYGRVLSEGSTTDTTSSHHLHTLHHINPHALAGPVAGALPTRGPRQGSGTSLGTGGGGQGPHATTAFTPDSLNEPQPGPSKALPHNHTPARPQALHGLTHHHGV
ncbi:uncharacterized protein LOC135115271 isoform X1 [Scylla paramamosain]|uniref:uncharacterized protein LOC135115271 isoform X1 n=1 Tax=Scylla paramamosain TaxID=85552 RepID=UPI003083E29A